MNNRRNEIMDIKSFCVLLTESLKNKKRITHILESDNSILVACNDGSNFFINIMESKRTFIHEHEERQFIEEYVAIHSKEDFAENILEMIQKEPGFVFYFMIIQKLEEMNIIDTCLFFHIMDNIIWNTKELDEYLNKLLNRFY